MKDLGAVNVVNCYAHAENPPKSGLSVVGELGYNKLERNVES